MREIFSDSLLLKKENIFQISTETTSAKSLKPKTERKREREKKTKRE